ncbi:MAG: DNA polymerase III subunit chi [Devosiaceae bacterium]|nr:DNA polymerase III subunit chi [Devosiaceae bacterium]
MSELLFYHLEQNPLEQVLPLLLQKSLEKDWNAIVQVGSSGEAEGKTSKLALLDKALWTFRDDSFLPHMIYDSAKEQAEEGGENSNLFADQPILLCSGDAAIDGANPNNAQIKFYVAGAVPAGQEMMEAGEYKRLVFMFDGHDPDAVIEARQVWKNLSKTHQATYWQQNGNGGWVKKA